jgi:hypothetical protein
VQQAVRCSQRIYSTALGPLRYWYSLILLSPLTTTTTAPQITIINNNNNNNSSCGRTYTHLVFDYPSCCGSQFTTPVLILRLVLLLVLVAVIVGIALPTRSLLFCSVLFCSASVPVQLYLLSLITCHPLRSSFLSALSIYRKTAPQPFVLCLPAAALHSDLKSSLALSPSALPLPIHSFSILSSFPCLTLARGFPGRTPLLPSLPVLLKPPGAPTG